MEHPKKGKLRDLASAEQMLGYGTEVGVLSVRVDFLMELAFDDDEVFKRKYEDFILRRLEEVKADLDSLVVR